MAAAIAAAAPAASAYAEVTADQAAITTIVDVTGLSATITVAAGRRVRITGHVTVKTSLVDHGGVLTIYEGAALLNSAWAVLAEASRRASLEVMAVVTSAAGAHTYKLCAAQYVSGTLLLHASAAAPAFILVEDIGPAA